MSNIDTLIQDVLPDAVVDTVGQGRATLHWTRDGMTARMRVHQGPGGGLVVDAVTIKATRVGHVLRPGDATPLGIRLIPGNGWEIEAGGRRTHTTTLF